MMNLFTTLTMSSFAMTYLVFPAIASPLISPSLIRLSPRQATPVYHPFLPPSTPSSSTDSPPDLSCGATTILGVSDFVIPQGETMTDRCQNTPYGPRCDASEKHNANPEIPPNPACLPDTQMQCARQSARYDRLPESLPERPPTANLKLITSVRSDFPSNDGGDESNTNGGPSDGSMGQQTHIPRSRQFVT